MAGRFVGKLNLPLDFIIDCKVVFPHRLGMTEWAPTFAEFAFFTVSTVGPMSWYSHHQSINCDTRRMGSHQLVRQPYQLSIPAGP